MTDTAFIPLAVPDLRGRERDYLCQCVDDNWVSSAGPFVVEFEQRMAAVSGRRHAVATVNGTLALQLALDALGIGRGDYVAVPDWTFAATANAVYHAGATPYFIDVEPESWTLDPVLLARVVADAPQRIAAIIAVDTLGHCADYDRICAAAGDIPIIADAAGAIGARYKGCPAGVSGHCATFSFNGNKTVTAGGGGMVVTDDGDLADRIRHLSTQARVGQEYQHDTIGHNARMTNLNAAVGCAQIERLEEMVAAKRSIAARYDGAIAGHDDMTPMPRPAWTESACWLYSLRLRDVRSAQSLVDHLVAHRIQARTFWRSLSRQAPYGDAPVALNGVSESLSGTVVSLPCSSHLTESEQECVIGALGTWQLVEQKESEFTSS